MVQGGVKRRGKSLRISSETWQRARDLVAAGRMSLREISRELGIIHSTLLRRKEKENWYDPHKEVENIPSPPPKSPDKKSESAASEQENSSEFSLPDPPEKKTFKDTLAWCQSVLSWAIEGVAKRAQHSIVVQCFLVEKLPGVIKSLVSAGPAQGTEDEQAAALRAEVEERLANIKAPQIREFDRGQEPEKQRNDKS